MIRNIVLTIYNYSYCKWLIVLLIYDFSSCKRIVVVIIYNFFSVLSSSINYVQL